MLLDASGEARNRSWTHRFADLAVSGMKAISRRTRQSWEALVNDGQSMARDWPFGEQPGADRSRQEHTGRQAPQPGDAPRTTRDPTVGCDPSVGGDPGRGRDPYDAMVRALRRSEAGRHGSNLPDAPEPGMPAPNRDGPDIG